MPIFEKKITRWLGEHAEMIFLFLVLAGGVFARIFIWDIQSSDMKVYLRWYERAVECGGVPGLHILGQRIKGYNALFQFLTAILTHLPGEALYKFKIVWTCFDILLAWGMGVLVCEMKGGSVKERKSPAFRCGLLAFALSFLAMDTVMNSAAWGQSDSVYVSLMIWSLVWIQREKPLRSFLLLGLAFAFKLQTIFLVPFYLFLYVYKKNFSCLYFLSLPGMLLLSALPRRLIAIISPLRAEAAEALPAVGKISKASGLPGILDVYLKQIASGGKMYLEFPSFWAFLPDTEADQNGFMDFYKFKLFAILLTVMILACLVMAILHSLKNAEKVDFLYVAFLLCFTMVYFLPTMIDRYGFIYEMLAIVLVFVDKRTIIPAIFLHILSAFLYAGRIGYETSPFSIQQASLCMLLIYGIYLLCFFYKGKEKENAGV